MIEKKLNYVLQDNTFKLVKNILFDDIVVSDFNTYKINDFQNCAEVLSIDTSFKEYYFRPNQNVTYVDFMTNSITQGRQLDLSSEDYLVINRRNHGFDSTLVKFENKLYLKQYNYSVSFTDIISKYKLPKNFLLKALTVGCPDDAYPEAKKHNEDFQKILDQHSFVDADEFKKHLIDTYTSKPKRNYLKINYKLLDLAYLCLIGDYELLTHTTLKLKIRDKGVFENVVKLLLDLDINKVVYNDIYSNDGCSVIIVNSSLIYSLFESRFDNFNFSLSLSKAFSSYFFKKIQDLDCIKIDNDEALKYIQEFYFRYQVLFKEIIMEDIKYLVRVSDYYYDDSNMYVKIHSINLLTDGTQFKELF